MLQESWLPAEARAVQVARSAVRAFPAELDRLRMLDAIAGHWGHGPAASGGSLCWFELPLRGGTTPSG